MGKDKEFTNPSGITEKMLERYDPVAVKKQMVGIRSGLPPGRKPRPHDSKLCRFYCTPHEYLAVQCFLKALRDKEVFAQLVDD